jgi:hypothetical protein
MSNAQCSMRSEEEDRSDRLLDFFNRADDGVEFRPIARFEFGMKQFSISADFKSAAARRNQGERFNALAEFENFGRQTDGLRRVVSNDAVFDRYFGFHLGLLSATMVRSQRDVVKVMKGARLSS